MHFSVHFSSRRGVESSAGPEISTGSDPKFDFDSIKYLRFCRWTRRSEYFSIFGYFLKSADFKK